MTKKSSARAAPIVSSAAAVSGGMKKTAKSAILRSAFSPSQFQLSLFASVIQGLDGQPLRIHEVISGTLKCERTIPRANITCLDWGYYGSKHRSSEKHAKKKRRKLEASNGDSSHGEDVVLALGTNHSEIHLFSPVKDEILAVLKEGHTLGIKDFKFKDFGSSSEAWSLGGDGKLVQWNVRKHKVVR